MVNFCNNIKALAEDVHAMLIANEFRPTITATPAKEKTKYTVRVARDTVRLVEELGLYKS